jgi:hypothetical protein
MYFIKLKMSNQICLKQETFDQLLSLALSNCKNNETDVKKHNIGEKITVNYVTTQNPTVCIQNSTMTTIPYVIGSSNNTSYLQSGYKEVFQVSNNSDPIIIGLPANIKFSNINTYDVSKIPSIIKRQNYNYYKLDVLNNNCYIISF